MNPKKYFQILGIIIPVILFVIGSISIYTTLGILYTLLSEAIEFFKRVPSWDFFTGIVITRPSDRHCFCPRSNSSGTSNIGRSFLWNGSNKIANS